MRPDRPDADLVVHPAQRLLELGTDLPAAAAVGAEQLTEPFAADHRHPRPVPARCPRQRRRRSPTRPEPCRRQPAARRRRRHSDGRATVTSGTLATAYRYGVPGVHGGVDVRRRRDRQDVAAVVVDRLERAVVAGPAQDQVPDRAVHRRPVDRHLADPADRGDLLGRIEVRERERAVLVAADRDPRVPVGLGVAAASTCCIGLYAVGVTRGRTRTAPSRSAAGSAARPAGC